MADVFTITPAIRQLAQGAIDAMINQLGKTCRMVFEQPQQQCPNCFFDPRAKRSAGTYNGTGPSPFTRPPCPVCQGTGLIGRPETFQDVRMLVDLQPKPYRFVDIDVVVPSGLVQTKGFATALPLVLQAKYMILDPEHAMYERNKFALWGEPLIQGNIVSNRYFIALWTRWSG